MPAPGVTGSLRQLNEENQLSISTAEAKQDHVSRVILHGMLGVWRKGLSLTRMTARRFQVLKKCLRNAINLPGRQGHPSPGDTKIRELQLLVSRQYFPNHP